MGLGLGSRHKHVRTDLSDEPTMFSVDHHIREPMSQRRRPAVGRPEALDERLAIHQGNVVCNEVHAHDLGSVRRALAYAGEQRGE